MKKSIFTLLLALTALGASALRVNNTRTQFLHNPVGIDTDEPLLSWQLDSDERSVMQTSYRIVVATDKAMAAVVYDSGVVETSQSSGVKLNELDLSPSTRYYWQVTVTDNRGNSAVSETGTFFETGLRDSGWSGATWIAAGNGEAVGSTGGSLRYDIDADITLVHDAASIIFSYTKSNCYFMWAVNTNDYGYPLIRRHVYANSVDPQFSDTRIEGMTNADFLGKERHLRLEIDGKQVRTYIDDRLVDTFDDNTGLLVNGLIGLRVYKDAVDERAYWDNIKVTTYSPTGDAHTLLSEDFESDTYDFSSGEIVTVNGNRKLYTYSNSHETKVMQDAVTTSPRFRKSFTVAGKVKSAKLYTSALGVYSAFLNGKRVGNVQSDGSTVYDELTPGWTDYRSTVFYMTHDVTSLLNEGENVLGAVVSNGWWNGDVSHGIYSSTNVAFIAKLVIETESGETVTVVTDESWLSSRRGAVKSGEIYHGEVYDARLADDWTSPGYDAALWQPVSADSQKHGRLMAHEGATVRVMPDCERKPVSITLYEGIKKTGSTYGEIDNVTNPGMTSFTLRKGQTMVVDFGQNASGWAKFKVKGKTGATLRMRYAEMVNDSGEAERGNDGAKGTLYTVALRSAKAAGQYTLSGDPEGEEYRPTTTFYGFRYMDMTASDDVVIEWITAETISSIAEENSSLAVNDADVNQLYGNIKWGQRSNFVSVPTDCPQRDERLGWTADTQVFSMAAMYNAQVQGFYHKWMRDMRDGQLENGVYPNVAPFNWVEHGSSAWADAGIILPWNVYVMYGDKTIIEENYESMERYMDWLSTQTDGKYQFAGSDTRYGDWLAFEDTDRRYVSVAYYGYMADLMSRMSLVLSEEQGDAYSVKAEKYAKLFDDIKAEFKTRYWNGNGRLVGLSQTSQCAYVLALRYNLLHDDDAVENVKGKLRTKIVNNSYKLSTGFLGTAVLNQTLSQFGMDDLAYSLLLQHECPSWLYSVDQGATTIWERWNSYTREGGFSKSIEMNSFNHYAYGAVGEWMYRYMAGIAPDYDNPGFKHIILKPAFDQSRRITDVSASFESNYGPVAASWTTSDDGTYRYSVSVPANTTATLTLPAVEGRRILENGNALDSAEGISDVAVEGDNITMTLGSGTYSFTVGTEDDGVADTLVKTLKVFPNPTDGKVTVESPNEIETIEVYTASGALLMTVRNGNTADMSDFQSGIYFLTTTDKEGNKTVNRIIRN